MSTGFFLLSRRDADAAFQSVHVSGLRIQSYCKTLWSRRNLNGHNSSVPSHGGPGSLTNSRTISPLILPSQLWNVFMLFCFYICTRSALVFVRTWLMFSDKSALGLGSAAAAKARAACLWMIWHVSAHAAPAFCSEPSFDYVLLITPLTNDLDWHHYIVVLPGSLGLFRKEADGWRCSRQGLLTVAQLSLRFSIVHFVPVWIKHRGRLIVAQSLQCYSWIWWVGFSRSVKGAITLFIIYIIYNYIFFIFSQDVSFTVSLLGWSHFYVLKGKIRKSSQSLVKLPHVWGLIFLLSP